MVTLVVLGLSFWSGHLIGLVPLHRALGVGFVAMLWTLSALGMSTRRARRLGLLGVALGAVVAMLGFAQQRLLVGDFHWLVRVTHLALGVAAMGLAARMARAIDASERPRAAS
jgi:hypothetical protein